MMTTSEGKRGNPQLESPHYSDLMSEEEEPSIDTDAVDDEAGGDDQAVGVHEAVTDKAVRVDEAVADEAVGDDQAVGVDEVVADEAVGVGAVVVDEAVGDDEVVVDESLAEEIDLVEQERDELREFVKQLSMDEIKSGGWFTKLLAHSLDSYTTKVDWAYFQQKYKGVPADGIVDQRIKMASRYAAIEGGLSASAYTVAIAATIGSGGGASPATVPAAVATVMVDVAFITRLQLRLAYDIAVLYRVPLDLTDPDDLWKLIRVALTIKGGEVAREGVVKVVPVVVRPLIKRFYSRGVLTAAKGLPVVGKFLLQRNLIKVGIPLIGVPLAVIVNRYTTQIAGRHARAVFRNEARVIEASTVLIERSHHPQLMLWVAWLVINSDGKISDDEALLMRQLVTLARDRHEIVDEAFAHLVDVDAAEVWRRIDAEPDDLTDIIEAAIKVAEIDGKMNGDEKQVVAELTERCHSAANPHPADVQAVAADLPKDSPPAIRAHRIEIAGQAAWVHDSHARGGTFHTYDQLTLDGDPYGWHKVHVWLPPAYSGGTSRHPVVFANDGQQVFFGGGIGQNWWIQEVVQQFPAAGTNETLPIIVGVDWRERSYEYLHKPITRLPFGLVKARLPFGLVELYRGGGLGPYSNYLADQIVPFIDSNYRTVRDRQHRVVLGSSHGGLAAFFTGVSHGDVFGQVIAMSPSFWAGTMKPLRKSTLYQWTVENLRRVETRPRIYIDWGLQRGGGYHNKFIEAWATSRGQDMRDILVHNHGYVDGVDLMAVADPDGEHDEDTWRRRLPGALRFALGT